MTDLSLLPESIGLAALSAGLLTNLASDILKHRSQTVQNPLLVRALKWAGFRDPDLDERIQDVLVRALQHYFKQHPHYRLSAIINYIQSPAAAAQIADYTLDGQPIDPTALEAGLQTFLDANTVSKLLIRKYQLDMSHVISDFLASYRAVLNQHLGLPEMALMAELLNQREQLTAEIRCSETRLQAFIQDLIDRKITADFLHAHAQQSQEQAAAELAAEMDEAGMLSDAAATVALETRLATRPPLFTDGLCAGRPLRPTPHQYFVSHSFDAQTLPDWRQTLADTLATAAGSPQPLTPYFAGDGILAGFKLCGISEKIFGTRFSTFLLPPSQDRNVYLELGIAIGLGAPFFLIQHYQAEVPPLLQSLGIYTKGGLFRRMRRELAGQLEEYDFGAVHFVHPRPKTEAQPTYLIAAGGLIEDEDFEWAIQYPLAASYPNLQPHSLQDTLSQDGFALQALVAAIQQARFAIYRVDEQCSPETFLALGISIGLNRPFLMLHYQRSSLPDNLRGIGILSFTSFSMLAKDFVSQCRPFLDKHNRNQPSAHLRQAFQGQQRTQSRTITSASPKNQRLDKELYNKLLAVLAECSQFETDATLRAMFVEQSLNQWQAGLPQANSISSRVSQVVDYLHKKQYQDGTNGLNLLLYRLRDTLEPSDLLWYKLDALIARLK